MTNDWKALEDERSGQDFAAIPRVNLRPLLWLLPQLLPLLQLLFLLLLKLLQPEIY
jgi:hypothetical protein